MHRALPLLAIAFIFLVPFKGSAQQPLQSQHLAVLSPSAQSYRQALQLWSHGKEEEAEVLLKQAVKRDPKDVPLTFFYACCVRNRFATKESIPIFEKLATQGSPDLYQVKFAISLNSFQKKQNPQAMINEMQAITESHPEDPLPLWTMQVIAHNYAQSREDVDNGILLCRLLMKQINGPGPVRLHFHYANLLDRSNDHKAAIVERRLTVSLKQTWWTLEGLANTLCELKLYDGARGIYARASKLSPDEGRFWYNWADCCQKAEEYEEGAKHCAHAIKLGFDDPGVWFTWGVCLFELEHYHEAIKKYREGLKRQPDNYVFYHEISLALTELHCAEEAQKMESKAEELKLQNPDPWGDD